MLPAIPLPVPLLRRPAVLVVIPLEAAPVADLLGFLVVLPEKLLNSPIARSAVLGVVPRVRCGIGLGALRSIALLVVLGIHSVAPRAVLVAVPQAGFGVDLCTRLSMVLRTVLEPGLRADLETLPSVVPTAGHETDP